MAEGATREVSYVCVYTCVCVHAHPQERCGVRAGALCTSGDKRPHPEILRLTAAPSPPHLYPRGRAPCQAPGCHLVTKKGLRPVQPGQAQVGTPAPGPHGRVPPRAGAACSGAAGRYGQALGSHRLSLGTEATGLGRGSAGHGQDRGREAYGMKRERLRGPVWVPLGCRAGLVGPAAQK